MDFGISGINGIIGIDFYALNETLSGRNVRYVLLTEFSVFIVFLLEKLPLFRNVLIEPALRVIK